MHGQNGAFVGRGTKRLTYDAYERVCRCSMPVHTRTTISFSVHSANTREVRTLFFCQAHAGQHAHRWCDWRAGTTKIDRVACIYICVFNNTAVANCDKSVYGWCYLLKELTLARLSCLSLSDDIPIAIWCGPFQEVYNWTCDFSDFIKLDETSESFEAFRDCFHTFRDISRLQRFFAGLR